MKRVVVDASVILKWVLGDRLETDHEKAMDLLDAWVDGRVEVFAPTLHGNTRLGVFSVESCLSRPRRR